MSTRPGAREASQLATLTAIMVVPTPPFGLKHAMMLRRAGTPSSASASGARSRERWKRTSSASTRASSSRGSNGFATTSSAPASRYRTRSSTSSAPVYGQIAKRGKWWSPLLGE